MAILVTGGTGFIGRALVRKLIEQQRVVYVLTRRAAQCANLMGPEVIPVRSLRLISENVDICQVINLAGAPIADRRWTRARKALLRKSRVALTRELVEWISTRPAGQVKTLISGSALGYYGPRRDDLVLDEEGPVLDGFQHQLCLDWEKAAMAATALGVRVCTIRTGLVLGPGGGLLSRLLPVFRLGLGGITGPGTQYMSWISLEDEINAILFLLGRDDAQGAYNLAAPEAVTNAEFTRILAAQLHRPAFCRVPASALKLAMGEASELLLAGGRLQPARLQAAGYEFVYPELQQALRASLVKT
jgi:uncharacterized protein (TIGR01777 family)